MDAMTREEHSPAYADKNIQAGQLLDRRVGDAGAPRIKRVDHALSRVVGKGLLAEMDITGEQNEEIYDPDFQESSHERPQYGG